MRKVIFQMMISLDGYFEGPHGELDWHMVDPEFNEYAADLLDNADTLLFGRKIYQLMANYWPTPAAINDDPMIAKRMNGLSKVVFSKTLDTVEWENSRLFKGDAAQEILRLKQQPGKNMWIGGSDFAVSMIPHNIIDEYRILVCPIVLGAGKTLFKGITEQLKLNLTKTRTLGSGVNILYYQPSKKEN